MTKNRYHLGIIDPGDYLKSEVFGGSTGFIKNILPYLNCKLVKIFGIGINGAIPWVETYIGGNVRFIPICKLKIPSKIPLRIKCLIEYTKNRNRIVDSNVDILYIHSPECCLPFLFLKRDIRIIYHQHGSDNPVEKSKYRLGRIKLLKWIFDSFTKVIYERADWIIGIDRLCIEQAYSCGAKKKVTLIMNAVDTKKFHVNNHQRKLKRVSLGVNDKEFAILFAGRLEKTKGPALILKCIPHFIDLRFKFHIFIAGDGSYKEYLKNFVYNNKYDSLVTFLGNISHDELYIYYNLADVLVLPSQGEGIPMVILEALACGTPVVASDVGGIPDLIINQFNGLVLKDLTPINIAKAIINVSELKLSRSKISDNINKLSVNSFIIELDKIIQRII